MVPPVVIKTNRVTSRECDDCIVTPYDFQALRFPGLQKMRSIRTKMLRNAYPPPANKKEYQMNNLYCHHSNGSQKGITRVYQSSKASMTRITFLLAGASLLLTGCFSAAQLPSPPPGWVPPQQIAYPHSSADCPAATIDAALKNEKKAPNAFTLSCLLVEALDPHVPTNRKEEFLPIKSDPRIFTQLKELREKYPYVKYRISDPVTIMTPNDQGYNPDLTQALALVTIDVSTIRSSLPLTLGYVDGRWRLDKGITCMLINISGQKIPECPYEALDLDSIAGASKEAPGNTSK